MKKISVVTPCFNEEGNVYAMYRTVREVFEKLPMYEYEHIFIDNKSKDNTARIMKDIAAKDARVKVIINVRNFGPGRSGGYAVLQAMGDAVIGIACDFQDPPELIPRFLELWEKGYKVVLGQKNKSDESKAMFSIRKTYYRIIQVFSEIKQLENVTGFGLYDKCVVDQFRWINDPDPYFRGTVAELGYEVGLVKYIQPRRRSGVSTYNVFRYLDTAINGLVSTSKAPLRTAIYLGFTMSILSFIIAIAYLIVKFIYWNSFSLGLAPILIGIFFFGSVQMALIGILGEYIGAILLRVTKRPLVVEERINFGIQNDDSGKADASGTD